MGAHWNQEEKGTKEMNKRTGKDMKIMVIKQMEEEEDGVDMEEDSLELTKMKKMSTGQEEEMRMNKGGSKHQGVEDQEVEVEGEEEE